MLAYSFAASSAHAKLWFGAGEHIRFVANTTIPGAGGQRLYLARKLTMHSFVLPYSVKDDGYVLGVSGDSKAYHPLPEPAKLQTLQAAGYLPNPLPAWENGRCRLRLRTRALDRDRRADRILCRQEGRAGKRDAAGVTQRATARDRR